MRVLCIDACDWNYLQETPSEALLVVGDVYHVIEQFEACGRAFYVLSEYGAQMGFDAELFLPLSDLDETEIHKDILTSQTQSHDQLSHYFSSALCVLAGEARETFTEKENEAITLLAQVHGDSVGAAGIRALIHSGESRQVLDELKPLCRERVPIVLEVLGPRLAELIESL